MTTNDTAQTATIPAHALKAGMVASLPHYNHGEPTEIATVEAFGPHLTRLTFVDYAETNTAYTMDRNQGVTVQAVTIEMWFTSIGGEPGDAYTMRFPVGGKRRHDMLRRLAGLILDVPQRFIRINSTQGVAWNTLNPAHVAYFNN
jgi:hypothetical protein